MIEEKTRQLSNTKPPGALVLYPVSRTVRNKLLLLINYQPQVFCSSSTTSLNHHLKHHLNPSYSFHHPCYHSAVHPGHCSDLKSLLWLQSKELFNTYRHHLAHLLRSLCGLSPASLGVSLGEAYTAWFGQPYFAWPHLVLYIDLSHVASFSSVLLWSHRVGI